MSHRTFPFTELSGHSEHLAVPELGGFLRPHCFSAAHASCVCVCVCVCVIVIQSCLTVCDTMDCSPPGSCPWDFPGKNMEWVAISFSRGSSRLRDGTQVSHSAGRVFTIWNTREAHTSLMGWLFPLLWDDSFIRHPLNHFQDGAHLFPLTLSTICWMLAQMLCVRAPTHQHFPFHRGPLGSDFSLLWVLQFLFGNWSNRPWSLIILGGKCGAPNKSLENF